MSPIASMDSSDGYDISYDKFYGSVNFDVRIFRCSQKVNCSSIIISRCFWDEDCEPWLLLKSNWEWFILFDFWLKMTTWACLVGSGLNLIFHLKVQLLILAKSWFSLLADVFISPVTEKKDVSYANSLALQEKLVARSLM